LCLIGQCRTKLGQPTEAAREYLQALSSTLFRREPLLKLAELSLGRSDFQGAAAFACAALSIPRGNPFAEDHQNYTYGPHALLYWALLLAGTPR